ncbi:hypothetical protein [Rhizobium sp. ZW T2_16]|uniref:hypothetical protein n=1 Tax=Rhizobium sp. ZW T2_16 TaxID=3378083 RepID=UPI0038531CCE
MSDSATSIETKGYNRGLILGFTMAESLLLVIFCLLLVAGAVIAAERQKAVDALRAKEQQAVETVLARKDVEALQAEVETLKRQLKAFASVETPDDWRELVVAKDTLTSVQESLALTRAEDVLARVNELVAAEKMRDTAAEDVKRLQAELAAMTAKAEALDQRLASLGETSKPHEWPPIISLSEANGNYFTSGSAELTPSFSSKLSGSISDQIAANLKNYGADIVEVIGHTDEQPLSRPNSNMDKNSINVLASQAAVSTLVPADNAGLGLARAISVANVLKTNASLEGITVLPLSAAQLILPGDVLTLGEAGDVETRRRIEIRIRRRDAPAQ